MSRSFSESTDWDKLLGFIQDKNVIPILGSEMYKFLDKGALLPVGDYLSRKLLEINNVTDQQFNSLPASFNYLSTEKKIEDIDIKSSLKDIVKKFDFELPLLNEFLGISDINYFINTEIYNNLLETKILKIRKQEAKSRNFSIDRPFPDYDEQENVNQPFVFNVFGSLLNTTDPALSDDEIVEFTSFFQERMEKSINILSALRTKNLIFLGCNFPDWLARFLLRLLTSQPLSDWGKKRAIYIVNDQPGSGLAQLDFLKKYNVVTYGGNTQFFAHQLAEKWKSSSPNAPQSTNSTPLPATKKKVFLSYASEDKLAVETLKNALETGLSNVECWYDKEFIMPGQQYMSVITENINSSDLFIALVSANSLQQSRFVDKEWAMASYASTLKKIKGQSQFIVPVVIDGTDVGNLKIEEFLGTSFGKVPQGNPEPMFITQLKEILEHSIINSNAGTTN